MAVQASYLKFVKLKINAIIVSPVLMKRFLKKIVPYGTSKKNQK
jgi:hypothetical protein